MAQLQNQMARFYDGLRPRHSNPTYKSTNIGSSLGLHLPFMYRSIQNSYNVSQDIQKSRKNSVRQLQVQPKSRRSVSNLSNAGTNSLKQLHGPSISDKEVYEKQQYKYNIINSQPKEYENTIRFFPKYRYQNLDKNYYRKAELQKQIVQKLSENPEGRETRVQKKQLRGLYLNHVDEVADII